jgi:cytochrome c-type biogenesis protein CcmE
MKPLHIVLIIVIIAAIGVVISTMVNSSTYGDFALAGKNKGLDYQIIGKLNTKKPIVFDAKKTSGGLSFFMKDNKGIEMKIIYSGAKPTDFEKSDEVVVSGAVTDSVFAAKTLLLKCPSKYNDKKTPVSFGKKEFNGK